MNLRRTAETVLAASLLTFALAGCTGGQEGSAAEEQLPKKNPIASTDPAAVPAAAAAVDAGKQLREISKAIPLYAGAAYREDLTRRDAVMIRNQYGPSAEVYTLATDDSYPQVYHYYTTYLAQFRAYAPPAPYPPEAQTWRTLEVQLNQAMQDPFIPGDTIDANGKQITLQIAETEAEPHTVIRYIVTPTAQPAGGAAATAAAQ
jgi:hypothetical protein